MNAQFAIQDDEVFILEVNPRASRTVPFVSKAIGVPLAKVGARCMAGARWRTRAGRGEVARALLRQGGGVPVRQVPGVDTVLGPEMKSTGEVMGVGETFAEAFGKAVEGAGAAAAEGGQGHAQRARAPTGAAGHVARRALDLGFTLYGTHGTARSCARRAWSASASTRSRKGARTSST
jgi:carbamoyl-phosphate synthase large subunit